MKLEELCTERNQWGCQTCDVGGPAKPQLCFIAMGEWKTGGDRWMVIVKCPTCGLIRYQDLESIGQSDEIHP